eukprot:scaffold102615_cov63-Phaeocystis_antarctica.AAC.2
MSANQHSSSWQNINTREDVQYTQESGRNLLEREGRTDIYRCDRGIVGPFPPISLYCKFAQRLHCSSPKSSAGGSLIVVRRVAASSKPHPHQPHHHIPVHIQAK